MVLLIIKQKNQTKWPMGFIFLIICLLLMFYRRMVKTTENRYKQKMDTIYLLACNVTSRSYDTK
jgi:hypothetical protein